MEEADALCDRIAIIDHGDILVIDTPDTLKNSIGNDLLLITASNLGKLSAMLEQEQWVKGIKNYDSHIYVGVSQGEEKIPRTINLAQAEGVQITSISIRKPTLEDVFLHYTGKTIRDEEVSDNDRIRERMRHSSRRHP
jgi:ABC-2 type transport system ATP-binding protein